MRQDVLSNKHSWIELFYPCGHTGQIIPNTPVRGVTHGGKRPIAFKWHNRQACKVTPQLIDWVLNEFQCIFITDAFKWQISCNTAPKELQWHINGPKNKYPFLTK